MMRYAVLALMAGLLVGADKDKKDGPKTVVQGTVTFDGKPLANATVVFVPMAKGGQKATGTTDEKGRYQLATQGNKAAIRPGEYKVVITKTVSGKSLLPAKYSSAEKTALTCKVGEGENTFDFALKSK
jgi:hypothetical protein